MEFPLYLVANTLLLVDYLFFVVVVAVVFFFLLIFISEILTKIGFLR